MNKLDSIIRGRDIFAIHHNWTVLRAAQFLAEKGVGAAAVLNGERVVGIFSERDLMVHVVVVGRSPASTLVSEVMTRNFVACSPSDTEDEALRKMQQAQCRHLPVIQEGRLLGFISIRDLLQAEVEEQGQEIKLMNEYLHSTPAMTWQ
jgi:CBS domain-containing protein